MPKNLVSASQTEYQRGDGTFAGAAPTPLLPITYPVGAASGYVWTSDAGGNGSWKPAGGFTAQYPDQAAAQEHGLTGGAYAATGNAGLLGLATAIGNRNNARVDIPVIGESITEGQGATAFTNRWIANANRAIRARYPTVANGSSGGLGFIPIQTTGETSYTWPISLASGGASNTDVGPVRYATFQTGASSYTWTAPAGTTSVKIMYFDLPLAGSFTYQVDSGGTTTVTNTGTSTDLLTTSISITSTHVLTIAWASGDVSIDGIIHYASDESSGITFNGCGHYGWGAVNWVQPETNGVGWAQAMTAFSPAAIGILIGAGDAETDDGNLTAAQFQVNLQILVNLLRAQAALASVPILFGIEYQINKTFADPGGWPAYTAATRAVQAATPNSGILADLNYRMPSIASNWDSGVLYADTNHPTNLGHALAGEIIAAGIRIA